MVTSADDFMPSSFPPIMMTSHNFSSMITFRKLKVEPSAGIDIFSVQGQRFSLGERVGPHPLKHFVGNIRCISYSVFVIAMTYCIAQMTYVVPIEIYTSS